jgi:hypothetical protein
MRPLLASTGVVLSGQLQVHAPYIPKPFRAELGTNSERPWARPHKIVCDKKQHASKTSIPKSRVEQTPWDKIYWSLSNPGTREKT